MLNYFLIGAAIASMLGLVFYLITDELALFASPLVFVALGLLEYAQMPRAGLRVRTISASPGVPQLLIWSAAMLILLAAFLVIDHFALGQGFHDPLKLYHFIIIPPYFVVTISGMWYIEKRYRKNRPS